MNLTEYIQINLPKKYQRSGCGRFCKDSQGIIKLFYADLLFQIKDNQWIIIGDNSPCNYWLQPQLLFWHKWVDENVFSDTNLCDTNIKTNSVLIRIATGMLNKLTCITEDEKRRLHDLLIEFYTERKRVYMDYHYMEVLGFPF